MKQTILSIIALSLLVALCHLTACTSAQLGQSVISTPTVAKTVLALPSQSPGLWPTPILTATPIVPSDTTMEEAKNIIDQLYKVDSQCRLDILNTKDVHVQKPNLTFQTSEIRPNPEKFWISEIADNPTKTLRAFVACDPNLCQQALFLENRDNGIVYEMNWEGRIPYRPISQITWIGNDLITFVHSTNPNDAIIATIQTTEEKFIFYWLVHYPCKQP